MKRNTVACATRSALCWHKGAIHVALQPTLVQRMAVVEKVSGLCYPKCKEHYEGRGTRCRGSCEHFCGEGFKPRVLKCVRHRPRRRCDRSSYGRGVGRLPLGRRGWAAMTLESIMKEDVQRLTSVTYCVNSTSLWTVTEEFWIDKVTPSSFGGLSSRMQTTLPLQHADYAAAAWKPPCRLCCHSMETTLPQHADYAVAACRLRCRSMQTMLLQHVDYTATAMAACRLHWRNMGNHTAAAWNYTHMEDKHTVEGELPI
jgi:hypothetical protein